MVDTRFGLFTKSMSILEYKKQFSGTFVLLGNASD
jgi:hypothetical protein